MQSIKVHWFLCSIIVLFSYGKSDAMMRGLFKNSEEKLQRAFNALGSRQTNVYKARPQVSNRGLFALLAATTLGGAAYNVTLAESEKSFDGNARRQQYEQQWKAEFIVPYLADPVLCEQFIKKTIELGKDPFDYVDKYGETVLIAASRYGRLDLVQLLMKNGGIARVNDIEKHWDADALTIAIKNDRMDVAKYFLENVEAFKINLDKVNSHNDQLIAWYRESKIWTMFECHKTAGYYDEWQKQPKKERAQRPQEKEMLELRP